LYFTNETNAVAEAPIVAQNVASIENTNDLQNKSNNEKMNNEKDHIVGNKRESSGDGKTSQIEPAAKKVKEDSDSGEDKKDNIASSDDVQEEVDPADDKKGKLDPVEDEKEGADTLEDKKDEKVIEKNINDASSTTKIAIEQ